MSRGTKLQEMEQSKTAVNANAAPGDKALPSPLKGTPGNNPPFEDLGGPTPYDASPTGDSMKLKEPKIKTVHDVVNKNAVPGDQKIIKSGDEAEVEDSQEVVAEEPTEAPEEVVSEQEEERIEVDIEAVSYTHLTLPTNREV